MNQTIELLLKRMESNPEEFKYNLSLGMSKWDRIYEDFEHGLEEEDKKAYQEGKKKLALKVFHEKVMEELLDPKSEESQWGDSSLSTLKIATQQAGQTHAQHMALHQRAMQVQQVKAMQAQMAYEAQQAQNQIKAQRVQNTVWNAGASGLLSNQGWKGLLGQGQKVK